MTAKKRTRTDLARARKRMRETPAHEQLRQARKEWEQAGRTAGYVMPRVPVYRVDPCVVGDAPIYKG